MPTVSGLEAEFPEKIVARNVDATTPESAQVMAALGFRSHGLVIRGAQGTMLWKQSDHDVNIDDVRTALNKLLAPQH